MNDDATSLTRLHDIVEPTPVSWWPLAPGWYVLLAIAACVLGVLAFRSWKRWRTNAYRRAALRALESATTADAITEVLRRTALAIAPRSAVATLTGPKWPEWLAARSSDPMSKQVSEQLAGGFYRRSVKVAEIDALRDFAVRWIRHHRVPESSDT